MLLLSLMSTTSMLPESKLELMYSPFEFVATLGRTAEDLCSAHLHEHAVWEGQQSHM